MNRKRSALGLRIGVLLLLAATAGGPDSGAAGGNGRPELVPSAWIRELESASTGEFRAAWDPLSGRVTTLRGRFLPSSPDLEEAARDFLKGHAGLLGVGADLADLELDRRAEDIGGSVLTFRQVHRGVPVFEGRILVGFAPDGAIVHVRNNYVEGLTVLSVPALTATQAAVIAVSALGAGSPASSRLATRLVVVRGDKGHAGHHLAWQVTAALGPPIGSWHVFVDAQTGDVVRSVDLLKRTGPACVPCDPAVDPDCGSLFFQNPVDATGDPGLNDLSDVDASQVDCVLGNLLSPTNLDGSWANTSLTTGRIGPPYDFLRSANQRAIDELTVYFHANRSKEYLDALGFPGVMAFSINIDAADPVIGDQSFYDPAVIELHFGEGGVDDGQDPDIVYHEYAHAIQDDQVPGYGVTEEGGATGEGFGDYWAVALTDTSFAPALGPACEGSWDATAYNPFTGALGSGCLRRTDNVKEYPRDFVCQVHADGEIWSAALWNLRAALGGAVVDPLVIKSHTFLTATANFIQAADALLSADAALFGGANAGAIHDAMKARGIPRMGTSAPADLFSGFDPFLCETSPPRYQNCESKECRFTVPGATRLRFSFSEFNTETGFDFLYISDADFNQVQALSGNLGAGVSATVSGDTIVGRFRSDFSIRAPGFVIDGVESLAGAGELPDGGAVPGSLLSVVPGPGGDITLSWGPSCVTGDTDFEIYEGTLGSFPSHQFRFCTTGGLPTRTFTPSPGSTYYLVVPHNGLVEGSYGRGSDNLERPRGAPACPRPQEIATTCR